MKTLLLADIHGSIDNLRKAAGYAREKQIKNMLLLGDYPAYGEFRDKKQNISWCKKILDTLDGFQLYVIPGNCDNPKIIDELIKRGINLHEKIIKLGDKQLIGYGGSTPTPYQTPNELRDESIYDGLEGLFTKAGVGEIILAVHQPPWRTKCDITNLGVHAGSAALREIVLNYQPEMLLCSHIHESGGCSDILGKTRIINIGALLDGRFGVLDTISLSVDLFKLDEL